MAGRVFLAVVMLLGVMRTSSPAAADGSAAFDVPPFNVGTIWLVVDDLAAPGDVIHMTLANPNGQTCQVIDVQTGATAFTVDDLGVTQAIADPTTCSATPGQWTATFTTASRQANSARFSVP